jgi:hypothetical protein
MLWEAPEWESSGEESAGAKPAARYYLDIGVNPAALVNRVRVGHVLCATAALPIFKYPQ